MLQHVVIANLALAAWVGFQYELKHISTLGGSWRGDTGEKCVGFGGKSVDETRMVRRNFSRVFRRKRRFLAWLSAVILAEFVVEAKQLVSRLSRIKNAFYKTNKHALNMHVHKSVNNFWEVNFWEKFIKKVLDWPSIYTWPNSYEWIHRWFYFFDACALKKARKKTFSMFKNGSNSRILNFWINESIIMYTLVSLDIHYNIGLIAKPEIYQFLILPSLTSFSAGDQLVKCIWCKEN